MITILSASLLSTLLVNAPAPPPSSPPAAERTLALERLQWVKEVDGPDPITALEVRNDFGDIRARAAAGRRLEAWMVVQRLDPGGERVGFTVERRGSVVALVVGYPPGRVRDADARPAKDGYDRLDLAVHVPEGVTLRAHTLRGRVEALRLKGDVEAATLDGPIHVRTTGHVRARTGGGEVTAWIEPASVAAVGLPLLLESESGPIRVTLAPRAQAELRVETAGPVASNLPLERRRDGSRTRATLAPAAAKRLLLVTSGSGAVTIEREEP